MKTKGFTLLEVMITLTLMGCATITGFQVFRTEIMRFRSLTSRVLPQSEMHTAEAIMRKDFRNAYLSSDVEESFFVAPNDHQVAFTRRIGSFDSTQLEEIEYETTNEPGGITLWRRSGHERTPIVTGLKGISFSFCDGSLWKSNWGWDEANAKPFQGIRGLPVFVSTQLVKDSESRRIMPVMTSLLNWMTGE